MRRARIRDDGRRQGRARCPHRRREHRRARSGRYERRLRRIAQCRRGRAAGRVVHAWPAQARRRRRVSRRRAHAVAGCAEGDGRHRSPPDRRPGRAAVRAQPGLQDRGRPQHRSLTQHVARVEAPHRPVPLPGSRQARGGAARGRPADEGRRADRPQSLLRHDQLQRHQRQRRDLRRYDDERTGVEDPRPCRRFPDPRRGSVRRWRRRGRRVHGPGRSQPVQPRVIPDRRRDATRQGAEGRGDGSAAPHQGQPGRETASQRPR